MERRWWNPLLNSIKHVSYDIPYSRICYDGRHPRMSLLKHLPHAHILRIGSTKATVLTLQKKIVFDEPAQIAQSLTTGKILAFGSAAVELSLLGAPDIQVSPIFDAGVVRDPELCREYLLWMRERLTPAPLARVLPLPILVATSVDCPLPYRELFTQALRSAHFLPLEQQPAVLGDAWMELGEKVRTTTLIMIRMGATQTQVALIATGSVVQSATINCGGADLDLACIHYLRQAHQLSVSAPSIVALKESYTKAQYAKSVFSTVVRGKHTSRSEIASVTLTEKEVSALYRHFFDELAMAITTTLVQEISYVKNSSTPIPIYLSGGLSLFSESAQSLSNCIREKIQVVSRPTVAAVLGLAARVGSV